MRKRATLVVLVLYTILAVAGDPKAGSATAQESPSQSRATRTHLEIKISTDSDIAIVTVSAMNQPPTGIVSFKLGESELGSVPLNSSGQAVINVPFDTDLSTLHAVYSGDSNHLPSDSAGLAESLDSGAALIASPSGIDFGGEGVGTTSTPAQKITLTNIGAAPVTLASIAISGTNAGDYKISANSCKLSPASLAMNETCNFSVSFKPGAPGASSATIVVSSDDPFGPLTIPLSGLGVNGPFASLPPSPVVFATQVVGVAAMRSLTLKNTGNATLTVASLVLSGANSAEFSRAGTCKAATVLTPGKTCTMNLTLKPTSVGSKTATLTITDDAADSPQALTLSGNAVDAPYIKIAPVSLKFASTPVGTASSPLTAKLTNIGDRPLSITGVSFVGAQASDFSVSAPGCSSPLNPKSFCTISVVFTPGGGGARAATLNVSSNALNNPFLYPVSGTGSTTAFGKLSPTSLNFGTQAVGKASAPQFLTLTNTGTDPLAVTGVALSGAFPGDYAATPAGGCASIAPSSNCTISVVFTPGDTGARGAKLVVLTNANTLPTVSLSGTGTNAAVVVLSATSIDFGTQPVGQQTPAVPIVLTNSGNSALSITSFAVSGPNLLDFTQTNDCLIPPATILPGGSCNINITFTARSVGARSAVLTIKDNAAVQPQTISLSGAGAGIPPNGVVIIMPPAITFTPSASGSVVIGTPAPNGGQQVFLSANNTAIFCTPNGLPSFVTVPAGQQSVDFTFCTSGTAGTATVTGFISNNQSGTTIASVINRQINFTLPSPVVALGSTAQAGLTLVNPAQKGGAQIHLSSSDTATATISPTQVTFPAGKTSTTDVVQVNGAALGTATLSATAAAGYTPTSISVKVVDSNSYPHIILGQNLTVAPGQSLPLPLTLSQPAPQNITINLQNSNPAALSVPASVVIPTGSTTPTIPVQITGLAFGTTKVTAADPSGTFVSGFQGNTTVTVDVSLSFSPTAISIFTANSVSATLNLSAAAPASGYTANLTVGDPTIATAPATVTFSPHTTFTTVNITGVAQGNTTLQASIAGSTASATLPITVNPAPSISLIPVSVGKDLETTTSGTLSSPAPAGNVNVTITSPDSHVLLATTANVAGSSTIHLQVSAGTAAIPPFFVQGLASTGAVTITATGTNTQNNPNGPPTVINYTPGSATITLVPSGFYLAPNSISTSVGSPDVGINVAPAPLDPGTLNFLNPNSPPQPLRGGIAQVNVSLNMSPTGIGTLTANPVSFAGGSSSASSAFHAVAAGSTTVSVIQPPGFTSPAMQTQIAAVVNGTGFVTPGTISLGNAMQTLVNGLSLSSPAPPGNLDVTITSTDASRVALSTNSTSAGAAQLTLQVSAGSQTIPNFYAQSVPGAGGSLPTGTVTVQVQATGFGSGSFNVALAPTGFVIFATCSSGTISTTNLSSNTPMYVILTTLDASGQPSLINLPCFGNPQTLAPGFAPVTVNVTSDTPSVGTVTTGGGAVPSAPVVFETADAFKSAAFHPVAPGTANLSIDTPVGYGVASADQQVVATVTASSLFISSVPTGWGLESLLNISLATPAPPGNEQITVTSGDPTKVMLSLDPTLPGSASVSAVVFAGTSSPSVPIYAQALNGPGIDITSGSSVDLTASSVDFGQTTNTISLVPAGFVLSLPYPSCFVPSFTTTTVDADTSLLLFSVPLDPATKAFNGAFCGNINQPVNPFALQNSQIAVNLSSSAPSVGAISISPVTFNAGDVQESSGFHPLTPGDTTLSVTTPPTGFSTPSNYQQIAATVTGESISLVGPDVGNNLETAISVNLVQPTATDTTLTVTSGDPNRLLLSTDPSALGFESVTVNVPAGSGSPIQTIYEQALRGDGTVTLTASSPGYGSATATVNLLPSGFILSVSNYPFLCEPSFQTSALSPDQGLNVYSVPLDPLTLNYVQVANCFIVGEQIRPGVGPVNIAVTTSPGTGGSIVTSPLTFSTSDTVQTTAFHPIANGTETISLGAPTGTGFSAPSNFQQIAATVTNPVISVSGPGNLGKDLQAQVFVSIPVAAPAPDGETITLTSTDTQHLKLAPDPNTVGTGSLTVTIPAGNSSYGPLYAQSLSSDGGAAITATGPLFDPGSTDVSFVPSGAVLTTIGCSTATSTSVLLGDTPLGVFLTTLNPVTLNADVYNFFSNCPGVGQTLRPGVAPISVQITSGNLSVGTVTSSPVVFQTNEYAQPTSFHPVADGGANVTINTPGGLTKPSNFQQIAFTVLPAAISAPDVTVGCNMQVQNFVSFGAPAPVGATVTLHSQDVTKLQLSTDPTVLGGGNLTLTMGGGETFVSVYTQAHGTSCVLPPGASSVADVSYTVSVTGMGADFAAASGTVHVMPSGFVITGVDANFFTTLSSADTSLQITPVSLDPIFLNVIDFEQLVPGLSNTRVPVITSPRCGGPLDQTVGSITVSPVIFNGADVPNYQNTSFHPLSIGATVIYVPGIPGFTQSSNFNCVTANVSAPGSPARGQRTQMGQHLDLNTRRRKK